MMQSLLITSVTNPQNSDVKAHKGIESADTLVGESEEVTQEGADFAKVMQESLDETSKKILYQDAANADRVSEEKGGVPSSLLTELSEDILTENENENGDVLAISETDGAELIDPQVIILPTEVDAIDPSEIAVGQVISTVNNQVDVDKNEATKVDSLIDENDTIASSVAKNETTPSIEATKVGSLIDENDTIASSAAKNETTPSIEATKVASLIDENDTIASSVIKNETAPSIEATKVVSAAMESETVTSPEVTKITSSAKESDILSSTEENESADLIEISNSAEKNHIIKSNEAVEVIKSIQKNDTIKSAEESETVKSVEKNLPLTDPFINDQALKSTSNTRTEKENTSVNTEVDLVPETDGFEETQLLSQIEAAQVVDVSVKMSANDASKVVTTAASLNANAQAVKETLAESFNNNINNNNNGNETNDESIKLTSLTSAEKAQQSSTESISKLTPFMSGIDHPDASKIENALQVTSEKGDVDSLSTALKNEGVITTQTIADVNGSKPNQTNALQLDRVLTSNQQTQTTNNLLQQPLEIQSKQAAAMMGERVMMMISQGKQEVNIRLDPAELGSMHVKIHVQQDQVQLHIQTQVGSSKDVIEQNMPRLREQLAQQGIQLGEANVEQQSQQQGQQQNNQQVGKANRQRFNGQEGADEGQTAVWTQSKIASVDQGIDYYA